MYSFLCDEWRFDNCHHGIIKYSAYAMQTAIKSPNDNAAINIIKSINWKRPVKYINIAAIIVSATYINSDRISFDFIL